MGHNRAGDKARAKARRRKREEVRLARKAQAAEATDGAAATGGGITATIKEAAHGVTEAVGGAVKSVVRKIKEALE